MRRLLASVVAMGFVLAAAGISQGADPQEVVKYRCLSWRHRNFTSHAPAQALETKLKSLGFQTYTTQQPGRYSVYYRLPAWRQKTFTGDAKARSLESWLKGLGCETQVTQP